MSARRFTNIAFLTKGAKCASLPSWFSSYLHNPVHIKWNSSLPFIVDNTRYNAHRSSQMLHRISGNKTRMPSQHLPSKNDKSYHHWTVWYFQTITAERRWQPNKRDGATFQHSPLCSLLHPHHTSWLHSTLPGTSSSDFLKGNPTSS